MSEVIELLAEMVRLPSVNPGGKAPGTDTEGEERMTAFVRKYLEERGVQCALQQVSPGRANVIAEVRGESDRTVVLETHMDTVSVEAMTIEPFEPAVGEGLVHGRGSCDAKASLAAMMTAMVRIAQDQPPPDSCVLAAVVDEEFGYTGVKRFLDDCGEIAGAVVGEPTMLEVVIAHKGAVRWQVITRGVSAHSSDPAKGVNAIYKMARVLQALEAYADALASREGHPLVGGPTLSVGTIQGGSAVNIVPETCEALVDRRLIPGERIDEVEADLLAFVRGELDGRADFELAGILKDPPLETSEDAEVVARLKAAAEAVVGEAKLVGAAYGTDASKFAQAGIPAIVCGPGDIAQAHTADEWIAAEQVERAADLYEAFLRR